WRSSAVSSASLSSAGRGAFQSKPTRPARFCSFWARISAGKLSGTPSRAPLPVFASRSAAFCSSHAAGSAALARDSAAPATGAAADHLLGQRCRDLVEVEGTLLLGHAGMEHDLEEQVAELLLERRHVLALDRVGDLVGLLDGVGGDGLEILLDVPGTAVLGVA